MRVKTIEKVFQLLSKDYPNPQTELKYINQYTFLISVILSAQATDNSVNKATKHLFKIVKNPKEMIELGEIDLKKYIKTIGLYNAKAKSIIKLSKILLNKHNNKIPKDFESLISLPGVGNKTASVYQNSILNVPRIAVDTHVFRVANRVGLTTNAKNPLQSELQLLKLFPTEKLNIAHHWLILHGRYTCTARKPKCGSCLIEDLCEFKDKTGE